jgi:hypothetical protein
MPQSQSQKLVGLMKDIRELASVTGALGWDKGAEDLVSDPTDLGAKPIPMNEWLKAFFVAKEICEQNPGLDVPAPGADPEGFVWLTWTQGGSRGLALELRKGKYKWTQRDGDGKRTIESDSLNDVAESARTVFVRVAA